MCACVHIDNKYMIIIKTAYLIVENSAQTSFRFSPISFSAPRYIPLISLWFNRMSMVGTDRHRSIDVNRQTSHSRQTDEQADRQMNKQTDEQTDRQMNKHTNEQTDRQRGTEDAY
jgi:hypothetical protein